MPSIPHGFTAALSAYAPALAALLVALLLPLLGRGSGWLAVSGPLAMFAGWALLPPLALLPRVIWAPHRGVELLLAPALACVAGALFVAWRGGRQSRLAAVLLAMFAGWWVAREGVGATDFWRAGFAITVLAAVIGWIVKGQADRLLVLAVALWGGLAVVGAGAGWLMAALVAAGCAAGLVAGGAAMAVPAAAVAALVGASDIVGGRLLRGRLDSVDVACLAALAAPFIADAAASRLGRVFGRFSAIIAGAIGAGAAVAIVWLVRRAFFT